MERAGALGFLDIDLRDRVDHFVYVFFVNVCIALGAIASGAILIAPPLLKVVGFGDTNWTTSDFLLGNLVIFTGLLVYLIMFKVLDYSRDRLLETTRLARELGELLQNGAFFQHRCQCHMHHIGGADLVALQLAEIHRVQSCVVSAVAHIPVDGCWPRRDVWLVVHEGGCALAAATPASCRELDESFPIFPRLPSGLSCGDIKCVCLQPGAKQPSTKNIRQRSVGVQSPSTVDGEELGKQALVFGRFVGRSRAD